MIFSDTYTFHKRYSLLTQTELDEYSEMPWLYTPLVDPQYNPLTISTATKQHLNKVLDWQYTMKSRDTIKNEYKVLGIIHTNQNAIKSYVSRFDISYDILRREKSHYIKGTETKHLNDVWEQIENIVEVNERGPSGTRLRGITQDQYGIANGVTVAAKEYDLSSFNSSLLSELNEYSTRNKMMVGGQLTICPDKVIYNMDLKYPRLISGMTEYETRDFKVMTGEEMFTKKIRPSYYQGVKRHLFGFDRYNLLTSDQSNYIIDNIYQEIGRPSADFKINLQYVFSSDGTLIDIICSRICYQAFQHCEGDWGFIGQDGVDTRSIPIVYAEYEETGLTYKT
tara:strand:+ start:222 stop:1235 length:1014 start_codon:yes stop_codon:yes gene_type:complete